MSLIIAVMVLPGTKIAPFSVARVVLPGTTNVYVCHTLTFFWRRFMSGSRTRRELYEQSVKRNFAAELSTDVVLCPKCGMCWVLPDTLAGRFGVCPSCWLKSKAEAERLAAKEVEAQREYDAARATKSRAMRKAKRAK